MYGIDDRVKMKTTLVYLVLLLLVPQLGGRKASKLRNRRSVSFHPTYSKAQTDPNYKLDTEWTKRVALNATKDENIRSFEDAMNKFRQLVWKIHGGRQRVLYRQPEGIIPNQKRRNKKRRRRQRHKEAEPKNITSVNRPISNMHNKSELPSRKQEENSSDHESTKYGVPLFISHPTIISRVTSKGNFVATLLVKGSDKAPLLLTTARNFRKIRRQQRRRYARLKRRHRKRSMRKLTRAKSRSSPTISNITLDVKHHRHRHRHNSRRRRRGAIMGGVLNIYDFPVKAFISQPTVVVRVFKPGRSVPYSERVLIRGKNGVPYRPSRHIPEMHRRKWIIPAQISNTRSNGAPNAQNMYYSSRWRRPRPYRYA
ncbi:uncharacterized protein LOC126820453 [Patella vulgata]|uniref:uncharacterized protein LOC126820453 n=1 Tax=Patella vulgata TaxID=6465 RepID=UPI0024A7FC8A|nr:uncharacterized protein LOC126820453 [Patella vulgata]